MAVLAPFGTDAAPAWLRFVYWLVLLNAGTAISLAAARLVRRWSLCEARPLLGAVIVAAGVTPPISVLAWGATRLALGPGRIGVLLLAMDVFVITAVLLAINLLADRKAPETHVAAVGAPPPKFLERLPPKLRGAQVYAVEAEDHYLRLHTSRGSDLILMRLSDAIAELEGLEGAQTHRSWWVAKDGYADAKRTDGRGSLVLRSGAEAPVSRTYAKALREAGWF